jgi:hypothetical protein
MFPFSVLDSFSRIYLNDFKCKICKCCAEIFVEVLKGCVTIPKWHESGGKKIKMPENLNLFISSFLHLC